MGNVQKLSVEKLVERMQELVVGEKIRLEGWHEYGDCFSYARVIQRIDTTPWDCVDMKAWVIGKCYEPEPLTIITEYDDYLENDVEAYLEKNELLEDGMVYIEDSLTIERFVKEIFSENVRFGDYECMSVDYARRSLDHYRELGIEVPDGITADILEEKWNRLFFEGKYGKRDQRA